MSASAAAILTLADRVVRLALQDTRDPIQWVTAVHDYWRARGREPKCRSCKCTQARGCPDGCSWIEPDLCSSCL